MTSIPKKRRAEQNALEQQKEKDHLALLPSRQYLGQTVKGTAPCQVGGAAGVISAKKFFGPRYAAVHLPWAGQPVAAPAMADKAVHIFGRVT